jgi:DNA-binding response OmpR family regulator
LVNDILEISRIETGRIKLDVESLDIAGLVEEVATSFEGQLVTKAMNLSLNLPSDLPHVLADKGRVMQILVNLLGNAWQYTPEGGNIIVRTRVTDNNFIQTDVEDTGIGIIEKDLPFVFDRFFRSERTEVQVVDGTGLGLSITKMFVEMLGGQIWVESQLDVGTTFSFTLPMDVSQAQAKLLNNGEAQQPNQVKMLLIDDNVAVTDLLKPHLEHAGYQVVVATEPEQALSLVSQAQPTLNLIILNLLLKNTNSFSLLEQLQQNKTSRGVPILISSLVVDQSGQDLSMEVIDYLSTSFEDAQVLERVRLAFTHATDNDQEISTPAGMESSKNGRYNILVVDDNQATVEWLKDVLDAGGYKVQRAFNSQQALDLAAGRNPDLILIDLKMPDVDGASVISQLYQIAAPKRVPIIVIVDQPVLPPEQIGLKMLGRESWSKINHSLAVDALIAEIVQLSSKPNTSQVKKTIRL